MATRKWILIGGLTLLAAGIIGVGVYMTKRPAAVVEEPEEGISEGAISPKPGEISPAPEIDTSDWKTYRNGEYGYSLKYPPDRWKTITTESGAELRIISLSPQQKPWPVDPKNVMEFYPELEIRILDNNTLMTDYINGVVEEGQIGTERIGQNEYPVYEVYDYYRYGNEYYPVPFETIFIQRKVTTVEILYDKHAKEFVESLLQTIVID
jgi:hypothetical protein